MSPEPNSRVWLITGAGRGLGRAFVLAALEAGDRVVATVRRGDALADLEAAFPDALRVLILDVRDRDAVGRAVQAAIGCFARIDVVINNAGRGLVAAAEEASEHEVREQFDTNVLGAIWVSQSVLPHLRERGAGHIVQISTVGGVGSMPLLGFYNASKWALEGFGEALAAELAPFGVRVTIAELGGFATGWAASSMRFAAPLAAYDGLRSAVFGTSQVPWPAAEDGAPGEADPAVAARALLAHVNADDGPLRLLVGDDAPAMVQAALERRRDDYRRDPRFVWPAV